MPKIDWNAENTRIVCKLFAEQVEKGNRPSTYLNALGYAEVEKGFKDRTGLEISKGQLKNKWDKLKEDFRAWKKLQMRETGTGWDPVKRTFDMDDEWWKKARADIPGCGKFRKQPLRNEEELARCFVGITNIGIDHWSPHGGNGAAPPIDGETQEEAGIFGTQDDAFLAENQEEENVISPATGKRLARPFPGKDKEKKQKTGNAILIEEAVTSMASSANEYVSKREGKYSIDQVMELVIACGAY